MGYLGYKSAEDYIDFLVKFHTYHKDGQEVFDKDNFLRIMCAQLNNFCHDRDVLLEYFQKELGHAQAKTNRFRKDTLKHKATIKRLIDVYENSTNWEPWKQITKAIEGEI